MWLGHWRPALFGMTPYPFSSPIPFMQPQCGSPFTLLSHREEERTERRSLREKGWPEEKEKQFVCKWLEDEPPLSLPSPPLSRDKSTVSVWDNSSDLIDSSHREKIQVLCNPIKATSGPKTLFIYDEKPAK
ncbi:hypothetical protein WMY93_005098 [Mugilogobius chulae]|uniref:Uncharacterized protein n=1 Tax=Mugilogobius chulae TaxID=88201 RepID=A0AAW0PQ82_9GOBI